MNDYFEDAFTERPAPRKRVKLPTCTDHHGNPIKRLGPVAIRRVLDNPINPTAKAPMCSALVFCEERGVSLSRDGVNIRTAEFTLCGCHPPRMVTFVGAAGRDKLIRRFLKLLRSGRSYAYPEDGEKT